MRIAVTTLIALSAALGGCGQGADRISDPDRATRVLSATDYEVYAAALGADSPDARHFVLLEEVTAEIQYVDDEAAAMEEITEYLRSAVPEIQAWGDGLRKQGQQFRLDAERFPRTPRFTVISQRMFETYARDPAGAIDTPGGLFSEDFPGAIGVIAFEPVGYSADSSVAYLGWRLGPFYCGTGADRAVVLRRDGGQWIVTN